jgi:mercuric ion transport protein
VAGSTERKGQMTKSQERYRKSCIAAALGTAVVALCYFTPLLVLVLGLVELSALTPYLDYVLLPALLLLVVVTILAYAKWRQTTAR